MSYEVYPSVTLKPLEDHPRYDVIMRISSALAIEAYLHDRPKDMMRGRIDPQSMVADVTRVDASGNGRGTYLVGAFVQEALARGATAFEAYAVHPGSVVIMGKLFGADNLTLSAYENKISVPFVGSFDDAVRQVAARLEDKRAGRDTEHSAVHIAVNAQAPAVQTHLYGDRVFAGATQLVA